MGKQIERITEIERMSYEMERLFIEAEKRQTLPKKHPSIIKAEALYNAGYRKQSEGEWKKVSDKFPRYRCTICGHLYNNREYKYCPFCGARMKGGE